MTTIYNARFWSCFFGLGLGFGVGRDGTNKFGFGVGREGRWKVYQISEGALFLFRPPNFKCNGHTLGQSTYLKLSLVVSFPAPLHLLPFLSSPTPNHEVFVICGSSPTKSQVSHCHRSLDPGWILCLWIAAYVFVVFRFRQWPHRTIFMEAGRIEGEASRSCWDCALCIALYSYQLMLYQSPSMLVRTTLSQY